MNKFKKSISKCILLITTLLAVFMLCSCQNQEEVKSNIEISFDNAIIELKTANIEGIRSHFNDILKDDLNQDLLKTVLLSLENTQYRINSITLNGSKNATVNVDITSFDKASVLQEFMDKFSSEILSLKYKQSISNINENEYVHIILPLVSDVLKNSNSIKEFKNIDVSMKFENNRWIIDDKSFPEILFLDVLNSLNRIITK